MKNTFSFFVSKRGRKLVGLNDWFGKFSTSISNEKANGISHFSEK